MDFMQSKEFVLKATVSQELVLKVWCSVLIIKIVLLNMMQFKN